MLNRTAGALVDRAIPVAVLVLVVTLLAGHRLFDWRSGEVRLGVDASIEGLLPSGDPSLERWERTREEFGSDDVLLVSWFAEDLFSPERLRALKDLNRSLVRLPGVEQVDSLASAQRVTSSDGLTNVEPFLRRVPKTQAAADALRDEILSNSLLVGQLVSSDGTGTLLAIQFEPSLPSSELLALVGEVEQISKEAAGDATSFVSGPIFARLETTRVLFQDVRRVLPLAVLGSLLVAAIGLRSVRGVVLPVVSNVIALAWTLALFSAAGHALNFVTVIMPPVVFVVGFAYAIHVVSDFDRHLADGADRTTAVREAVEEVVVPLSLTAFTTAVGFSSLAASDIESIRLFGLFSALGVLLAWIAALVIVPLGLLVLPAKTGAAQTVGRLEAWAPGLARFDMKNRRSILIAGAALAVISVAAAFRIDVSTDFLRNFPAESAVRQDFERLAEKFDGAVPIQVVIETDVPEAFKDPAQLRVLGELQDWLISQPEIGSAISLADYMSILYRAFVPDATDRFPKSAALADQLLLLGGGDDVERFADPRFRRTVIQARSTAVSSGDLASLLERIDARLADLPDHLRGYTTGSSVVVARTIDDITRGQVQSLAGACLVIYLVLAALFGSFRIGAVALIPNVLPILVYFGILGLSGITLNATTGLVASVVLGIAVDDSIHFLSRFNAEARRVADEQQGVVRALTTVIRPVTFTTAALCIGFMSLLASDLRNQIEFGLLAAATLAVAWILDLTFTPALSGRLRFVTLWEALTVDLGAEPHKTIPFFSGLSHRQARIAALMGRIEEYRREERILSLGEEGSEICVVIDGQLVASLPRDGEDRVLRVLRRGDLIGEVALFHGKRTANVDTTSDVRVLRLDQPSLERIQTRYPRIGAQLYRNLGVILADRLADTTGRL